VAEEPGYAFDTSAVATTGEVRIVGVPTFICRGDTDGNNATDPRDLNRMTAWFGIRVGASRSQGDLNGDGAVDIFDFHILLRDFGCGPE